MEMAVRSARNADPLLMKLGLAFALSVAGYFVVHLRCRYQRHPLSSPSASEPEARRKRATTSAGLKDELRILGREEGLSKIINCTSSSNQFAGNCERFPLPDFNELVLKDADVSGKDPEYPNSIPAPRKSDTKEDLSPTDQAISHLKNLIFTLQEWERNLEIQMKINNMEVHLFWLKIESLQSENQRLVTQILDHSTSLREIESEKMKIRVLKRKIRVLKRKIRILKRKNSSLRQMVGVLQGKEEKHGGDDLEMDGKLERLKEVEDEVESLAWRNSSLCQENLELKKALESAQVAIDDHKAEELEQIQDLKQSKDNLLKEFEQLQTDHCSDVEEIVYLRWVNACLRHELRNHQPPQGRRTVSRDLTKKLSPKSEEKAKQIILEYADLCIDENGMSPGDVDEFSSHASTAESDDAFFDINAKQSSKKSKFFSKLKKFVIGNHHNGRVSALNNSIDGAFGRESCDGFSSSITEEIGTANRTAGVELQIDEDGRGKHPRPWRSLMGFQRMRRMKLDSRKGKGGSFKSDELE